MEKPLNIAIVGLGVMGGSFAWALQEQEQYGVKVMGIDHDSETLNQALQAGAIDSGELTNQTILQQADIVILTLYPGAVSQFMKKHQNDFKVGAMVTDVTGVKGDIIDQVTPYISDNIDFVFGHPMAGKESQGFAYADSESFQGANYLITPVPSNKQENLDFLEGLFQAIGFKRVSQVTPAQHDEMIAFVSQICHILAVSLINSDDPERQTANFVGDSYRELTRVAKINASLWSELFLYNKKELLGVMEEFQEQFTLLTEAIEQEDETSITILLEEATKRRINLEEEDSRSKT